MQEIENYMQKHANYTEQMNRLKKAVGAGFYLEAILIEYAIIEDRLKATLCYCGRYNEEKHKNIGKKIGVIRAMTGDPKNPAHKYFSTEFLDQIMAWKEKRNSIIHSLLKQNISTEEFNDIALEGQAIVKTLNNKVSCYRRSLMKLEGK